MNVCTAENSPLTEAYLKTWANKTAWLDTTRNEWENVFLCGLRGQPTAGSLTAEWKAEKSFWQTEEMA